MIQELKAVSAESAQKTIGVVTTDLVTESEQGNVRVLAFQARGQTCGFYPDSTALTRDKRNVRDGHYQIWGTLHFYARLSGQVPTDATRAFVERFGVPQLDSALVEAIAKSGNVPQCAMHVQRATEMGDLAPYNSSYDCYCLYERAATGKLPAERKSCAASSDCPAERPSCNYGFCEQSQ